MAANARLTDRMVAIMATDGFEQVELTEPYKALRQAGATVHIIAPKPGKIRGWNFRDWGEEVPVDRTVEEVDVDDYDALVLPGGVMNPDKLRMVPEAVEFTRRFMESGKPVCSICHGPWVLAEADVVRGREVTSYPSIRTDLRNAGANVVDREVAVDGNLVTSRDPNDLPAFCRAMVGLIAEGVRAV